MNLLPCPFCGGPAKLSENVEHADYYGFAFDVSCERLDCAAMIGDTAKEAADKWNIRNGKLEITNE